MKKSKAGKVLKVKTTINKSDAAKNPTYIGRHPEYRGFDEAKLFGEAEAGEILTRSTSSPANMPQHTGTLSFDIIEWEKKQIAIHNKRGEK
jgi:hypothetical protein